MTAPRSLYDILNVSPTAEAVVIEAAYRALMKKYHPDQASVSSGGPASAAEINQAFAVLRDPTRRADYDRREWMAQQSIRLAETRALAPARRANAFGWGGWIVALLLGCAIALITRNARIGEPVPIAAGDPMANESTANARLGSQPPIPRDDQLSAAMAAEIRRDALADRTFEGLAPPADKPLILPRTVEEIPAPTLRRGTTSSSQRRRTRRHPSPRSSVRAPEEPDFLEREGYIY